MAAPGVSAGVAALQRYDYVVSGNTLTGTYSWQW
jgi:hypothetical protein